MSELKTMSDPSEDPQIVNRGWDTLESLLGIGSGRSGPVSIREALQENAVLACVDVISRDVSSARCALYRKLPNSGKQKVEPNDHWLARLLALDPNTEHTWAEFWQMMIIHLLFANNAFIVKRMNRRGQTTEVIPVAPGRVTIDFHNRSGEKIYYVSRGSMFDQVMLSGIGYYLGRDDVVHVRKRVVDGLHGYSTLAAGGRTLRLAESIEAYKARLYDNDGQPRITVQQDEAMKPLSDPAFQRMKEEIRAAARKMSQTGEAMLLEPGYTAKILAQSAADMKITESSSASVEDIARLFGVPPHKIGHVKDEKYSNMEVFERLYAHDVLIPIALAFEDAMGRSLLTEDERLELFLEFDRGSMSILDFKVQAEVYKIGIQNGAVTPNQYLALIGQNPLPGDIGERLFYQSTMTVVDAKTGNVIVPAGSQAEPPVEEDPPDDEENKGLRLVK